MEVFTQKIVTKLSKIWVWDPGYGKNLFRNLDPGVKKAPDLQHCIKEYIRVFLLGLACKKKMHCAQSEKAHYHVWRILLPVNNMPN
jgi:hypothetical protein